MNWYTIKLFERVDEVLYLVGTHESTTANYRNDLQWNKMNKLNDKWQWEGSDDKIMHIKRKKKEKCNCSSASAELDWSVENNLKEVPYIK